MLYAIIIFNTDPADSQQLGSLKAVRLKFQDPSGHPIDVEPEQVRAMLISSKSARFVVLTFLSAPRG